ncbi:MAG: hypothetical protein WKF58_14795 [Ilumatobacteraceae bacterium]
MTRGIWGDPERFVETYWARFPDRYFAGDGARADSDGYFWVMGRIDDVMNVSGHRISTSEVESALVSHPAVAEAAVVGANDPMTGQAIIAYVITRGTAQVEVKVSCASTSPPRSARSRSRRRSTSRPICRRRAAARSCGACCATSPRDATSVTRRRSPTPRSSTSSRSERGAGRGRRERRRVSEAQRAQLHGVEE